MRTHVEFTSAAFPAYADEDAQINPRIWGKRLVEYLASGLRDHGVPHREPHTEDWGWVLPIENAQFPMFVGCSNQLEPGGDRFLCFIEPSRPEVRRGFFRRVSTVADVERVTTALDAVLRAHPDVRDLRWWDDAEGNNA